ncbi:hypothetical protein GGR57DRAFT_35243 [Xylariaceae sp. FL1272]|nr:hypothetical protein GGR57DRAFT_35243 [Xylariaceae sp. FL1272]
MTAKARSTTGTYNVSGRTAIVTGAGSGINYEFAALLLSLKCNVVFADIALRPEADNLVKKYCGSKSSPRSIFVKTNVSKWSDLTRMFTTTLDEFNDFDILCPGAGVYEPLWSSFWHPPGSTNSRDGSEMNRYALLDINLTHPIRATQMAISLWLYPRSSSYGLSEKLHQVPDLSSKRIVHIGSVAGYAPNLNAPLYGATKFGITGFVRCLAPLEAAIGVRVNAVAPGVVRTPLWVEHPEKLQYVTESTDAWVAPEEVAQAMLRCVTEADLVAGTILEVGKKTRKVTTFNDPGPDMNPAAGLILSHAASKGIQDIMGWLKDGDIWGRRDSKL